MLAVYLAVLILGGTLVVLSVLGASHGGAGDFHADAGAELHADADTHVEVHAGGDAHAGHHEGDHGANAPWLPFLSLRFWTYFFATTGAAGVLLTLAAGVREPMAAILSSATGAGVGLVVSYIFRWMRLSEVTSLAGVDDMLGKIGLVTVPIRESQPGRIRCTIKGEIIDFMALGEEPLALEPGAEVVIVGVDGTTAKVVPKEKIFE